MKHETKITLLVGGSIAAYKSAELLRALVKQGADVHVVMSKAACEFITPLTMQTLSGYPATVDIFDLKNESNISHIELASKADIIVAAPCTANFLAKVYSGIGDDAPSTILLAAKCPVLFVPAMNVNMWQNPVTQRNVSGLSALGYHFVEPESGELACGWTGPGRFPEIDSIMQGIDAALSDKDLLGTKVVVTSGPTIEPLDPIRFISNRSSGKMGYAIAAEAKARGAEVYLVSGPCQLKLPCGVHVDFVETAQEMQMAVMRCLKEPINTQLKSISDIKQQLLFMVSAVSDHRPAQVAKQKLKHSKKSEYDVHMIPNPDILEQVSLHKEEIVKSSGFPIKIIGFAAETGSENELLESARDKLKRKNIDLIAANLASDSFGQDHNKVWLINKDGEEMEIIKSDKRHVAKQIIDAVIKENDSEE